MKTGMLKTIIILFSTVDYYNCICERRQVREESGRRGRKMRGRKEGMGEEGSKGRGEETIK